MIAEPDLLTPIEPPAERPGNTPSDELSNAGPVSTNASEEKFDWFTDDSVIIQEQLALAVYRNALGAIVIRQEARNFDEDDHFVILRDAEAVRVLIAALQRELKVGT